MINVSDSFVRIMNYSSLGTATTKLLIVFAGGTQPTSDDIAAIKALSSDGGTITVKNLLSWASGRGDQVLNFNAYGTDMKPSFPNHKFVRWPLTQSKELFRQVDEGTPTWFAWLVLESNEGSNTITYSDIQSMDVESEVTCLGTVGDEESEADLKLLGGYVDEREYSTTDLEFSFA